MRSSLIRFSVTALLLGASVSLPLSAQAQLANGSFETPTVPPGTFTTVTAGSAIGDWTVVGVNVLHIHTTYSEPFNGITQFNAQDGLQSVDLTGGSNTGLSSGVQQDVTTQIGQEYSLSFYVGRASSNSAVYQLASTADLSINGGARVSFINNNATFGAVNWQQFTTNFTATTGTTSIAFFSGTDSPNNNFVGLDNVVLTPVAAASAPEPGVLALLLPVAGGVAAARRRPRNMQRRAR